MSNPHHLAIPHGVATICKLPKVAGRLLKRALFLWGSFAKETCEFREPTNCCQPVPTGRDKYKWGADTIETKHKQMRGYEKIGCRNTCVCVKNGV